MLQKDTVVTDGVVNDNSNVTYLYSYLVDKLFSIILLGLYRLSFKFWFLLGRY